MNKEEIDYKHKYKSKCSEFGAYKKKVQQEVRKREFNVELREKRVKEKELFLEKSNYVDLNNKYIELQHKVRKVYDYDRENRKQLEKEFENIKNNIIDKLSEELVRFTELYDVDNEKTQGYLIGINKAKKIIKEEMNFKLIHKSLNVEEMLKDIEKSR